MKKYITINEVYAYAYKFLRVFSKFRWWLRCFWQFVNALANIPNIPSEIKKGIDKGDLGVVLGDYESVTARDFEFIAGLTGSSAITKKLEKQLGIGLVKSLVIWLVMLLK